MRISVAGWQGTHPRRKLKVRITIPTDRLTEQGIQAIEAGGLLMRIMNTLCAAALAVIASWSTAEATTLSGNLTADNLFDAYISTDDTVLGTLITSGNSWPTTVSFSGQALTAGVTNYLHIVATDQGKPDMFIGSFSLSDSLFHFANAPRTC